LVAKYPDEFGNMFEFRKTPGVVYGSWR
jgi:hypothetical protein